MGVILDESMQKEFDALEAKGAFSLADEFRRAHEVSLEALASMAFVPAKYQTLVANSTGHQIAITQHDEKAKQEEKDRKERAERAVFQQQLDRTMLEFTMDGQDIQISQGDLRKEMKQRVEELENEKKELVNNGGSPEQVHKADALIEDYKSVMTDGENKKLDPDEIKNLMQQDPAWASRIERKYAPSSAENTVSSNMRTSFSSEAFNGGGITAAPLTTTFANSASPPAPTSPAPAPMPALEKRQQNLSNTLQAAGF